MDLDIEDHPSLPLAAVALRCCHRVSLAPAPTGSRRRRLWELDGHALCPVVGLCLPVAVLRRLAAKAGGETPADDYDLHCQAVNSCKQRSRIAEAVQRQLDQHHALALRAAAAYKTEAELLAWWEGERCGPHMAGALWALLTHARCTAVLERKVLGHVHMQQHELGQGQRALADRTQQVQAENVRLLREKAAIAARADEAAREQARQRQAWQAETVHLRGLVLAREALVAQLSEEVAELRRAVPDLPARKALSQQLQEQIERARDLQRALDRAQEVIGRRREGAPEEPSRTGTPASVAASPSAADTPEMPAPLPATARLDARLQARAVLCVGGRTGAVPHYRRLVEHAGARFMHHDGGEEESAQRLEATLAAADIVICQTGCVSHDAYWRVKDHCKRTGKRCVFVDTPSSSGLQRALAETAGLAKAPL